MKMNMKVLGINSGLGVSLYPFKKYVIGNVEGRGIFHTPGNEQWKANFGNTPLIKSFIIPAELYQQRVDVVISSPDCGSGSILRLSRSKVYGNNKENKSLLAFINGIELAKPKFFYMENLPALFKSFPISEFEALLPDYYLMLHEDSVSKWGNSQITRKRLVVIGIRKDLPKKVWKYFKKPDYSDRIKTCKELYGDLYFTNANGHVREPKEDWVTMYGGKKMKIEEVTKDWQSRLKGKSRYLIPKEENRKFASAPGVYRNIGNKYPSTARKASRQFDDTGQMLTPRQLARIQGVPDDFKIYINPDKLNYWINKGRVVITKTPPMEISSWFKRQLKKSYRLWQTI